MRIRLSDTRCQKELHTADARYHEDCRKSFMRGIQLGRSISEKVLKEQDNCLIDIARVMENDKTKVWSSIELHNDYRALGGKIDTRWRFTEKIKKYFGDKIIVMSSPGIADIVLFKDEASNIFKIEKSDDQEVDTRKVAQKIIAEISEMEVDKDSYKTRISTDSVIHEVSPTLTRLLSDISPEYFQGSALPSLMIGNIVTKAVSKSYPSLLVDLAVLVNKKELIEHLHEYGVVCSYDEFKRFRSSAADYASKQRNSLCHHSSGLVQAVSDNFDVDIHSMNGLQQTHSLAMMILQSGKNAEERNNSTETVPRRKVTELREEALPSVSIVPFVGPKKPQMPEIEAQKNKR